MYLKKCPKCREDAVLIKIFNANDILQEEKIMCLYCGYFITKKAEETLQDFIYRWNKKGVTNDFFKYNSNY